MMFKKTIVLTTLIPTISLAAPLEPPVPPDNIGSAMYSIWDICKRLDSGAAGEKKTFQVAPNAPAPTGCSLNDIMDKAPAKSAVGVSPNEVAAGKEYWGLIDGNWGLQTGTAPSAKTDPNLKPENIRAGVSIFGVVGSYTPSTATPKPETPTPTGDFTTFRDTLKDGGSGPEMVMIPAGSFRMGDIQDGGDSDEQPVHSVSVKQFAMGKFEVTFAEYDKFAEATGREKTNDRGWGRGNRPVINVSWNDATAYTEWLSDQTGKQYRLPTEAEWEYAARAGTETRYWWGNEIGNNNANCSDCGSQWDNKKTAPVGSFATNKFGLYDVSGNVWEWSCSEFTNLYNGNEKQCMTTENSLSIRGGSWINAGWKMRSADRDFRAQTFRNIFLGFRVSRQ